MSDIVKNYAKEYAEEAAKNTARKLFEGGVIFSIVQSAVNLPEAILINIYEEVTSCESPKDSCQ